MCIACSTLCRHILKEVRVCFSSYVCSKKTFLRLNVQTRIHQPFSVQSFHEGVLEFEMFTTATRKLRVVNGQANPHSVCCSRYA